MIMAKLKKLLTNKFFYAMLGIAAAVIAVSGYMGRINDYNEVLEQYSELPLIEDAEPVYYNEETYEEPDPVPEEEVVETAKVVPLEIVLPLEGDIIEEFSKGQLVYNRTLGDWRTHNGVDIAAEPGTPVKAAAEGVVTKVGNDGLYGFCITIDHGGFQTKYCGLQESDIINIEQKVEEGEVIGGIGTTAQFEVAEVPHLHFELYKDGQHIDPLSYIIN